jgi:hypothetical protein
MNRNLVGILITLALSLLVSVPNTYAQTVTTATVPFAFVVGRSEMPAGTYTISPVSQSVIAIRDRNTGKGVLSFVRPEWAGNSDGTPKLEFNKYGSKYFLSRVSPGFGHNAMQLPTSNLERELRIASARGTPEQTVVAAKQ